MTAWASVDEQALLDLLRLDTVTPMETGRVSDLPAAQDYFARHAAGFGFEVAHLAAAKADVLVRPDLPLMVGERAKEMGERLFFASQPNLVLRLGVEREQRRTLVINGHLDTVSGEVPVGRQGDRVTGRGAVDAKGPLVAAAAGIRHAKEVAPRVCGQISVLIQAVGGEEGGAMGFYGTRELVRCGYLGRLNVVAEPTRLGFFDYGTVSMTARVTVNGVGATDDAPAEGDNATLLLGHLACEIAERAGRPIERLGAKLCVAGLHTGDAHNRVYGNGALLLNLAYAEQGQGDELARIVEVTLEEGLASFRQRFAEVPVGSRTAAHAERICRLEWLKRGLPVLANRDAEMEQLLKDAGVPRHDPHGSYPPFTCDAMWLQGEESYSLVLGPGDLVENGAHTSREFVRIEQLAHFAEQVSATTLAFAEYTAEGVS